MEKLKQLSASIMERAKTDKKFCAALIGGVVVVIAIIALIVSLSGGTNGGGTQNNGGTTDNSHVSGEKTTYKVTLRTKGGMVLSDIDIYVYADEKLTKMKGQDSLNEEGTATFELPESDEYYIAVSGAPKGYEVADYYKFDGTNAEIVLSSSLVTDEDISAATLKMGDVMYDFTVTTTDGNKVTLSEVLKEKKMVMLNFWYTTCSWCITEFPIMAQAYETYKEDIEIIALNPMGEGADAVKSFQQTYELPFMVAECPTSWSQTFAIEGYPTSVFIDQYGVICCVESGAITSLRPFSSAFAHFTADDYKQVLCENGISDLVTKVKPTATMPSSEEIEAAINGSGMNITYRGQEGDSAEYTWPFVLGEKNGEKCIYASNKGIEESYAMIYAKVELKAGQAIAFDYLISSEATNDYLAVIIENQNIFQISGVDEVEQWKSCYPWVAEEDGEYELLLTYLKDASDNAGDDTAYIKNMRVVDASEVDTATYLPKTAAVEKEDGSVSYVDIVYNQADGYYHVGSANGPLLLADLLNTTMFNEENSAYLMVFEDGEFKVNGESRYAAFEQYASYASNSSLSGVTPVTQELYELLVEFGKQYGFEDDENEWLKLCKYYAVYGTDVQLENPIKGLAPFSAYEAKLGKNISTNSFYYDRVLLPRGYIAEFIPEKSGVYRITSHNESEQGVEGWIFDENRQELLVYEPDERMYGEQLEVSMVYYMEAGKPYYIDIAFGDMYEEGTITYDIEYIASTYNLFRLASPPYFTYEDDTMYYTVSGGINVVLGEDGIYYEDLGNGQRGSKLYCDFVGITSLFDKPIMTNQGVTGMIDMGAFDFSKDESDMYVLSVIEAKGSVEAADAYLKELWGEDYASYAEDYKLQDVYAGRYHGEGQDYTEAIRAYCSQVDNSGNVERNGCVVVTKELAELLQMLMEKYTFENVDGAWKKLCYYYDYLGPAN